MDRSGPLREPPAWSRAERALFAAILLLAFGLRLAAVLQYEAHHPNAAHPSIDEASYDGWARAIAAGDWLGKETFFQEPLYPYALGLVYRIFGPHRLVARVLQCLAWAVTAGLAGLLARRLFGRAAGFAAAALLALYAPGLLFPAFLLKENLLLPVLALLALALARSRTADEDRSGASRARRLWFLVGVLAGAGALLRGNMLVLLPVLCAWPLARARRLRRPVRGALDRAALVLAGAAIWLLPVAARNFAVGGAFLPTTSGAGTNLYGGNQLGNPFGRAGEPDFVRAIPEHEAADWRREAERRVGHALGPAAVSSFWFSELVRSVREHPGAHLAILWNKLRLSLGRYEVPDDHCLDWDARYVQLARTPLAGFGVVGALGLAGLLLLLRTFGSRLPFFSRLPPAFDVPDRGAALEIALLFLLYLATIVLTVTSDRARLPLVILLAPFAAWSIVWACRAAASWNQDALVLFASCAFAGILAVFVRTLPASEIDEDLDERDYNLAVQLERGDPRSHEARAIADRLVARHARSARARILLAEMEFHEALALEAPAVAVARRDGLGRALERVSTLRAETSLNPRERFRAASLCGWIELELGDCTQAESAFRDARSFDPDARDLREGLARAWLGGAPVGETSARARSQEAVELLRDLAPGPAGSEGLLAEAEFSLGRALLDDPASSDEDRKLGKSSVQSALTRLQTLVKSPASEPDARRRGRLLAGSIQLYRRNWKPAENHYRAAMALSDEPAAELGLVEALLGGLEAEPGDDRAARIEEVRKLLERLSGSAPDPAALADLRAKLERLR